MSPIFITLFIVLVASATTINAQPEIARQNCGRNGIWSYCASRCPTNCEDLRNPNPIMCTADCVHGCKCLPGYIRKSGRSTDCILETDCPNLIRGNKL